MQNQADPLRQAYLKLLVACLEAYSAQLPAAWLTWFKHPETDFQLEQELERLGQSIDWYDGSQTEFFNQIHQAARALSEPDYPLESLIEVANKQASVFCDTLRWNIFEQYPSSRALRAKGYFHCLDSPEFRVAQEQAQRQLQELRSSCGC